MADARGHRAAVVGSISLAVTGQVGSDTNRETVGIVGLGKGPDRGPDLALDPVCTGCARSWGSERWGFESYITSNSWQPPTLDPNTCPLSSEMQIWAPVPSLQF